MTLKDELSGLAAIAGLAEGAGGELYADVAEDGFRGLIGFLSGGGFILDAMFCCEGFAGHPGFTLLYAFERRGQPQMLVLRRRLKGASAPSIEDTYPAAFWYEREIRDGFGVEFDGALDRRRLFLHGTYPEGFHPLLKSFKNGKIATNPAAADDYRFKEVKGEEVYQIPVGPVHAGIIEPGHFRFSVIGEQVYNLEVRMFYKHRGVEKLAEGRTPAECVKIAEAISGDETAANSVGYCDAVEKAAGVAAPPRAWHARTVFLELERMYSHLGDMAGMVIDVAYPAGAAPFFILREELLRQCQCLTGSRFMRGAVAVGGLSRDVDHRALDTLSRHLDGFNARFEDAVAGVRSMPSVIDRFERTGIVRRELVEPLNLTGPTARAAGAPIDGRADRPYGIYGHLKVKPQTGEAGDVLARFDLKAAEVRDSHAMIHRLLKQVPHGEIRAECAITEGYAMSAVEAARGQNIHWVSVKAGLVDRYKVRTASFCNWQAIEHAVIGNIVPDFPLINKSLNLSYAGTDL
jgi:formate hydrogenlyase subunit 5